MRDKAIQSIIAHPENRYVTKQDLDSFLRYCDKDQYADLRDRKITIPQFKARVTERYFGIKYIVLDDFKKDLDPEVQNDENVRKMMPDFKSMFVTKKNGSIDLTQPVQVNKRCLRSIKYKPPHKKSKSSSCF
jgi:hypothetical protein